MLAEAHARVLRDAAGGFAGTVASYRDVAQEQATAEALRESEERFRAVQDNSLDRFTLLRPLRDDHGEIVDFVYVYQNARAAETAGRSPEELVGLRMTEVFPGFPETRFFSVYRQVAETGQATEFEELYSADGVNEWFRAMVAPTSDGIAVATQIITERKRAEAALRESEQAEPDRTGAPPGRPRG